MSWDLGQFEGKDVVFVGKGKGRSFSGFKNFLEKNGKAASITAVDKEAGVSPLGFLTSYDQPKTVFVKNEAIPEHEMPVPYLTTMQLFFDLVKDTGATTVGITGTKGKSTTSSLTAHILQTAGEKVVLAGNIGNSPLESLDTADQDTIFVLELSSYQLSDLITSPHISACINLYNDHTDWHGSLDKYWEAKHNIMRFAGKDDVFIYDRDYPALQGWADAATCRVKAVNPAEELDLSKAKLFGDHNRMNALFAREIAREFGVSDATSQQAINSFEPLEHRMELVATKHGHTFIDDAIGMTPESTIASLKAVTEKYGTVGCLLLGGQDRSYDFHKLMQEVSRLGVRNLVLFPDTIEKMKASLPVGYEPEIHESKDMADAVAWAAAHAGENTVVLLSTAAPSYSLWSGFPEKGDQFKAAVNELA